MYSHDYAPFWHLKEKTKYLKKTPHEVCFIFIRNTKPDEDYFGEGSFRHKESWTLKKFKERIREKFNPYEHGKRSENHIIHATDSQNQANEILKYLGHKEGVQLFYLGFNFLNLPYYLKTYTNFNFKTVKTNRLFCRVLFGENWEKYDVDVREITESPHYKGISENPSIYEEYVKKFTGGGLKNHYNINKYLSLVEGFKYLNPPHQHSYVIVEKKNDKYVVLDGLHRACIHAFQGNSEIKVCQVLS
jgi:hypothetical protein